MSIEIPVKVNGEWKNATPYVKVNGSWVELSEAYVKKDDTWVALHSAAPAPEDCMYLTSASAFTVAFSTAPANMYYSLNGGAWTQYTTAISVTANQKVYFWNKDSTLSTGYTNYYSFVLTGSDISAVGDMASLLNFNAVLNYCFLMLFYNCTSLSDISGLTLPSSVAEFCYMRMFMKCSNITTAPTLPATTMAKGCYNGMFAQSGLTEAPALPAMILAQSCYANLFYACNRLTTPPALPATTMASYCYYAMFCFSLALTSAPALPATTLAEYCYSEMFSGCESLTSAPELPATTLAESCYEMMFMSCTSLMVSSSTGKSFFTCPSTIPSGAVSSMFSGTGGSYTSDPVAGGSYYYEDPLCFTANTAGSTVGYSTIGTVTTSGIQYSTDGSTWNTWDGTAITLSSVGRKIYVRNTNSTLSTGYRNSFMFTMTGSIAASGNVDSMINYGALSDYCYIGLFNSCIALTSAPKLPATILAEACYLSMFALCSSLTTAPALPATTLEDECYDGMFLDCTSLTTAPKLPAMALSASCYDGMFSGCTSLTTPPELPATTLASSCYHGMFYGCTSLTSAPRLPATTLVSSCYSQMFYGCTSLNIIDISGGTPFFDCPSTVPASAVVNMFYGTGGPYTSNPVADVTYSYVQPLCFTAAEDHSTVGYTTSGTVDTSGIQYSTDGVTWSAWDGSSIVMALTGMKVYVRNTKTTLSTSQSNVFSFTMSGTIRASGDVDSMINYGAVYSFCYNALFSSCSSLISAPELPSTSVASGCYMYMFAGCSIENAPILPATTLAMYCYYAMFNGCSSLKVSNSTGTKIFTCPSTVPSGAVGSMFTSTGGTYTSDPVAGGTYYYYT